MTKYRLFLASVVSGALVTPVAAVAAPVAITREQIAAAIGKAGTDVSPEQITLLSEVVATTSAPALTIESMEPWGERRTRVRLACAKRVDCLPFFVSVQWNQGDAFQPAQRNAQHSVVAVNQAKAPVDPYLVRAGSSAILLLEGGHVHIRLSVVCLENGAIGQTIRVTSKDRKQTYKATVTEGAILRGTLS